MPYVVYRGDRRSAAEIRAAGGFNAWVPLTVTQARNLMTRFNNVSTTPVVLPRPAHRIAAYLAALNGRAKLLELVRMIKQIKDKTSVQISTDLTDACGGYGRGYKYRMEFDTLYLHDGVGGAAVRDPASLKVVSHFGAKMITDTGDLNTATVIAVTSKGDEVSFLTSIPVGNIKGVQPFRGEWADF